MATLTVLLNVKVWREALIPISIQLKHTKTIRDSTGYKKGHAREVALKAELCAVGWTIQTYSRTGGRIPSCYIVQSLHLYNLSEHLECDNWLIGRL